MAMWVKAEGADTWVNLDLAVSVSVETGGVGDQMVSCVNAAPPWGPTVRLARFHGTRAPEAAREWMAALFPLLRFDKP